MSVSSEYELGQAIKNNENKIEIRGELASKVVKIKMLSIVLWIMCMCLLATVIASILMTPTTCGASAVAGLAAGTPAAGIIGVPATVSAIMIALSGGGVSALNRLRNYRMKQINDNYIILYRR